MRLSRGSSHTGPMVGWALMALLVVIALAAYFLYGTRVPPLTLNVTP